MKNLVPKRRFKGFVGPWEVRKLGDVSLKIGSGKTPLGGEKAYKDYGICLIRSQNINFGTVNFSEMAYIDDETDKEMKNSRVFNGDVLLNITGASIGRSAVYNCHERANVNQHVCIIRPQRSEISPEFIHLYLSSNYGQKQIDSREAGGAREGLNFQQISKMAFSFPKIKEQKQIGIFFSNLDNLIALDQCKLDKLQDLKSAYLYEMFPQKGELFPKRRFVGFTEAWEQSKLDDVSDVRDGTHDSPQYHSEGHPFITSKNVKDGNINYDDIQYISDVDFKMINKRSKVDKNDILMGMIGTIGNIALVREEPDYAIKNVALIKDIQKINCVYLYHYLQSSSILNQLSEDMDGGTQNFIALNKIRNLAISIPKHGEQLKIGAFLQQLDNLITLQQRKLVKLKALKDAFLNEMFV